jgi:hypothetical protein
MRRCVRLNMAITLPSIHRSRVVDVRESALPGLILKDLVGYGAVDLHMLLQEAGVRNLSERVKIVRDLLQGLRQLRELRLLQTTEPNPNLTFL